MVSPSQYKSILAQWNTFTERFKAVGLPEPSKSDFRSSLGFLSSRPSTIAGWYAYKSLLENEGGLTDEAAQNIQENIDRIRHEKSKIAIEKPRPDSDRRRLDMVGFFERISGRLQLSSAATQEPLAPLNFLATEISIPVRDLTVVKMSIEFVRYHLDYGLLWGYIEKHRYYDRGAGSFPGSSGAWVTAFRPVVRPFMDAINLRKFRLFKTTGQYQVLDSPPVIIGRKHLPKAFVQRFSSNHTFWTQDEARKFLSGDVESVLVRHTLPVEMNMRSGHLVLRFLARPEGSLKVTAS